MHPSGGQNNDRWTPGQPPPAVDPWQQSGGDQAEQDRDDQEFPSGESHYSVPPIVPTSGYADYAAPQHTSGFPTLNPPTGQYQPPSPVSPAFPPPPQQQQPYPPPPQQYPPSIQFPQQPPVVAQPPTATGFPAYAPPPPPGQPAPLPPPPRKSNTGLILGLVGGAIVLVLALCVGVAFATNLIGKKVSTDPTSRADNSTTAPGGDDSPTPDRTTANPTPVATARDLSTLDTASTDRTPFELKQFFPVDSFTGGGGETYTLTAAGFYSACENSGGTKFKALVKQNGCGNMAVGVYLNAAKTIMTGVMVMPLPAAANATNVFNGIKADSKLGLEFWIWCPPAGQTGADICASTTKGNAAYRQWWYSNFHRYMIIAIALHTDGRGKGDANALTKTDQDCLSHVVDALPIIRS